MSLEEPSLIIDQRILDLPSFIQLRKNSFLKAYDKIPNHHHGNAIEICYMAKGQQIFYINDRMYSVQRGDSILIYPHETHSTGGHPQEKSLVYTLVIQFPKKKDQDFLCFKSNDVKGLLTKLKSSTLRAFRPQSDLKSKFEKLISLALNKNNTLRKLAFSIMIVDILLEIVDTNQRNERRNLSNDIKKVIDYIHANYTKHIDLNSLANLSCLSLNHFKVKFTQYIGIPPREYILRLKIDEAIKRLKKENSTITEIAFQLGFSSSQYFSTTIKKYTRRKPKEFQTWKYLT